MLASNAVDCELEPNRIKQNKIIKFVIEASPLSMQY